MKANCFTDSSRQQANTNGTGKRPWLAALLNVVPLPIGLGYLYLGHHGRFARSLLISLGIGILAFGLFFMVVSAIATGCLDDSGAACSRRGGLVAVSVAGGLPFALKGLISAAHGWRLATKGR